MTTTLHDNSILAKLLAEEDLNVVHKQVSTASFNVESRELVLPMWKDMTKDVLNMLTLHEVGHALYTPLDGMEDASKSGVPHAVINILEDVRIEKMVQSKYPGSVRTFVTGYGELHDKNFFKVADKDLSKMFLIDRINLHFKKSQNVPFTDDEMIFVNRAYTTKTMSDVIELGLEIMNFMEQNEEHKKPQSNEQSDDTESGESGGEQGSSQGEQSGDEQSSNQNQQSDSEQSDSEQSDSEQSDGDVNQDNQSNEESKSAGDQGGVPPESKLDEPDMDMGETDTALSQNLEKMVDSEARDRIYAYIPKSDSSELIVPFQQILDELSPIYTQNEVEYYPRENDGFSFLRDEYLTFKKDSKRSISFMVKEFEMKKSAEAYSRSTTAKTGSLDMGKLHTYKFNEDLFAKVNITPNSTNHGMVMYLDWSGSMSDNLLDTVKQLFSLVWFCDSVKIPFEVYAFSDGAHNRRSFSKPKHTKVGDLNISDLTLLNFFSSNMNKRQQNRMMEILYNLAYYYSNTRSERFWKAPCAALSPYRDFELKDVLRNYTLSGTPLNHTIIAAMDLVPEFKKQSGVQKVNVVFLTDGDSHPVDETFESHEGDLHVSDLNYRENSNRAQIIVRDRKTNAEISEYNPRLWRTNMTIELLQMLRKRIPDITIAGFFIAGSGKNGKVTRSTIGSITKDWNDDSIKKCQKELRLQNVLTIKNAGYDEYYVLPSSIDMSEESIELDENSSKAQIKKAFSKKLTKKSNNRPVLRKFIDLVA